MSRRDYLRILGAGIGSASLAATSALDSVTDVPMELEEPVLLEDITTPQSVFHEDLEEADFYSGRTLGLKHDVWRDDELVPLYIFRRTLGFPEMSSSPVEITTRTMQLPPGESDSYEEELEAVFDWAILSRNRGARLSSKRFSEQMRSVVAENDADVTDDTETNRKGHNKRQTVDEVWQYEQWTRQAMEEPRDYMNDVDSKPTSAFWEYTSFVEMTDWGAFEVSIAVEQPSGEYQTLRAVRDVAELQRKMIRSSPKPQQWVLYGKEW